MRKKIFIAAALGLLNVLSWGETTITQVAGSGILIKTIPPSAKVYIDGVERGYSPLSLSDVIPGIHKIKLTKDYYNNYEKEIVMQRDSRLEVSVDLQKLTGRLSIHVVRSPDSPPADLLPLEPVIFAGGRTQKGSELELKAGNQTIRVQAFGWEETSRTVDIKNDKNNAMEIVMRPSGFTLESFSPNIEIFNPKNINTRNNVKISYTVSAPGTGQFTIINDAGYTISESNLLHFNEKEQTFSWDGKDASGNILPDGLYFIKLTAWRLTYNESEERTQSSTACAVRLDTSTDISPLSMLSSQSGLLFAPINDLPHRNFFQIDGTVMGGKFLNGADAWETMMFAAAARWIPALTWEVTAAFNGEMDFSGSFTPGAFVGVKKIFTKSTFPVPRIGAAFSYGWVDGKSESGFGTKAGVQLSIPVSFELPSGSTKKLSFHLTPAILWTGSSGFPSEPIPRIIIQEGALFRAGSFSAGISAQSVIVIEDEENKVKNNYAHRVGVELKYFVPKSALAVGLLGGTFFGSGGFGGFAGLTLSFMN
ncbi:hypothetical protein AGMMS50212_02320 [Spirochaetia bacterium]|nr:hypothetical protein AGMMS50212_02320 [Spirochaetia bacterium]